MRVEIRSDVDVGGREVAHDLLFGQVVIHEANVLLQAQILDPLPERLPIAVHAVLQSPRVGFADDQVDQVGVAGHHLGQRLNRVFQSFAGADQAKGAHHPAARNAQPLLYPLAGLQAGARGPRGG